MESGHFSVFGGRQPSPARLDADQGEAGLGEPGSAPLRRACFLTPSPRVQPLRRRTAGRPSVATASIPLSPSPSFFRTGRAVGNVAVLFAQRTCNEQTYPHEAADMYNKAADEWAKQNRMAKEEP